MRVEPVGVVEETGPDCKKLKKGDVVGWGYLHNSCGECEFCMCSKKTAFGPMLTLPQAGPVEKCFAQSERCVRTIPT